MHTTSVRRLCAALFLLAAAAVLWFLQLFTQVPVTMKYIDWQTSVSVAADGTERAFQPESYGNSGIFSGTYRFSGKLPENLPDGHLLFETNGLDLTLSLNGETLWQSRVSAQDAGGEMAQATVPLPAGTEGTVSMTCTVTGKPVSMFPPLVRFLPANLNAIQDSAFSFRTALPTGAAAFALLLALGIFLLGISAKKPDFSLIPLVLALAGLVVFRISQDSGYYFLPERLNAVLSHGRNGILILLALLVYLAMNRKRSFWRLLGMAAAWSAAAFFVCLLISALRGGYLSYYVGSALIPELRTGYFDGLVYWLTLWLTSAATLISAYGVSRAFAAQEAQAQALRLKNKLTEESYRELKAQTARTADLRHEWRHQLTALDCLCRQKDYAGIEALVSDVLKKQKEAEPIPFTDNQTVNVILQDTAAKAAGLGIHFRADTDVPASLPIPDADLCSLLMNMLDNALEAAAALPEPGRRFISIRIRLIKQYQLAVKCENSFAGSLKRDSGGNLLTTKSDPLSHGFGLRQMDAVAHKYASMIVTECSKQRIFTVQTVLQLPEQSASGK